MSTPVYILGAGGQGQECLDYLNRRLTIHNMPMLDIKGFIGLEEGELCNLPVFAQKNIKLNDDDRLIMGIGDPQIKRKLMGWAPSYRFLGVIAPYVYVSRNASYGIGHIIAPGVIINTNVKIGEIVLVNYNATIGHETTIGDCCTIGPGANISGKNKIGDRVYIGAGVITRENITICNDVIIGAGAVVVKDITEMGTYVGVPARRIK